MARIKKNRKTKKTATNKKKKIFITLIFICFAGIVSLILFYLSIYVGVWGKIPTDKQLAKIEHQQASTVYASDLSILGKYYTENRTNVEFNTISSNAIDALIATEDVRFYKHGGIDRISLLRVLFKTLLLQQRSSGGGSTISQQLAKNLFPRSEQPIRWMPVIKIKEMIIAERLENVYSKEQILVLYLNTVSFGENTLGIESAAQQYFSKSSNKLTPTEAATIIGMLKAPTYYNPRLHPERSLQRRNVVLSQMKKYEYITNEEHYLYIHTPLNLKYHSSSLNDSKAPYYLQSIKNEISTHINTYNQQHATDYDINTSGLRIYTTINTELQEISNKAVIQHLKTLQKLLNKEYTTFQTNAFYNYLRRTDSYLQYEAQELSEKQIIEKLKSEKVNNRYNNIEGEYYRASNRFEFILEQYAQLQAGVLAIDPTSGAILSWVGGANYQFSPFDQIKARRQVGSVFKPIVYSSAIKKGITANTYFENKRTTYTEFDNWSPQNSSHEYTGFYTMEGALSKSINTIAVDVLMQVGIENVITHAHQLQLEQNFSPLPSLALGVASLSMEEMIRPYLIFANEGRYHTPYSITKIVTPDNTVIFEHKQATSKNILSISHSAQMNQMLQTTVNSGTARRLRSIYEVDSEIAAKTGTTQNHVDGWFIGYNPRLVIAVRVGANDPSVHFKSLRYGQAANMALPIFARIWQQMATSGQLHATTKVQFPHYDVVDIMTNATPFKEDISVSDTISSSYGKNEKIETLTPANKKEKKIWRKITNIFRAKDKRQ